MKATKYGNRYQITYRCPGFPRIINEYFDTLEEAELRISCIKLEKKRGTLTPPAQYLDSRSDPALLREKITVSMLMQEYLTMYGLNHWSESTLSCNRHRINDYIIPYIGDWTLKSITTHRLEQFYQDLLTRPAVVMKGREGEKRTVPLREPGPEAVHVSGHGLLHADRGDPGANLGLCPHGAGPAGQ